MNKIRRVLRGESLITNRGIRKSWCLVVGHDEKVMYNPYDGSVAWCDRCWYYEDEINMDATLPWAVLNRFYCWLVEREWAWWEWFDAWLRDRWRLPYWWEY